ncbi:Mitochondrial import inner membrane translocase subunit tim-22 [Diplonema papillatum]|nr:Mitochondrial import inner membrane translocase subunit tim-22 [Diplonema papillatum]
MNFEHDRSEQEVAMEVLMDSCAARSVLAGVGGYVMGAGFSVFGMMLGGSQMDNVGVKEFWRRAGRNALKMGRGFAAFGFFFSGFEAVLEKRRGVHDWTNAGLVGGGLGAVQGYRFGGPPFALAGATGGAGFCALIDWFMEG